MEKKITLSLMQWLYIPILDMCISARVQNMYKLTDCYCYASCSRHIVNGNFIFRKEWCLKVVPKTSHDKVQGKLVQRQIENYTHSFNLLAKQSKGYVLGTQPVIGFFEAL